MRRCCRISFFSYLYIYRDLFYTSVEGEFQCNKEINRKCDIIRYRAKLQNHIQHIVDLAEIRICWLLWLIEGDEIEDAFDMNVGLEFVYVDGDQYDVVVAEGL